MLGTAFSVFAKCVKNTLFSAVCIVIIIKIISVSDVGEGSKYEKISARVEKYINILRNNMLLPVDDKNNITPQ